MDKKFKYILRFTVAPGVCEDERIDEMIDFCKRSKVDDVMVFTCGEELNTGHITPEEWVEWNRLFQKIKSRLTPLGITASLNPWGTTTHCDRGRKLREGQNFRTMVDPFGGKAEVVVCQQDDNFLKYIGETFARYAEAGPDMIWIEDDMRLHNHRPLTWGGCFCDYHMKLFSDAIGHEVSREEFVAAVCAPGDVHPYRKVWLDTARETICRFVDTISKAVFAVNPDIRLGLMCSAPYVHCAEGRDWARILDSMTGNRRPMVRIHLNSYEEITPQKYSYEFSSISRLTKEFLPADIEVAPELESYPYSAFTKSRSFTDFQIKTAALLPSVGITMNIFDMMGSGVISEEKYDEMLAEASEFLDAVRALDLKVDKTRGVAVPASPTASYRLHTRTDTPMTALYPREHVAAAMLSCFGVSNHYVVDSLPQSGIAALSGQSIRYYENDLDRLFRENRLILDGEAILALADMGRLDLIGADKAEELTLPEYSVSFEEFTVPTLGKERLRLSDLDGPGGFVGITSKAGTSHETLAVLRDPTGKATCDTICKVGGNILILPYVDYAEDFGRRRRRSTMQVISEFVGGSAIWTNTPYLNVYEYTSDGSRVIALANFSGDDIDSVTLNVPDADDFKNAVIIPSFGGKTVPAPIEICGNEIKLNHKIERLGAVLIKA